MKSINKFIILSLLPIVSCVLTSCYNDNLEDLDPGNQECDTTNVTFSKTILPIINEHCTDCHSGSAPSGNISLSTYDEIAASAEISEGEYGSLYGVINYSPGNSPMPPGGSKLS